MFCSQCGKQIPDDSQKCPVCDKKVTATSTKKKADVKTKEEEPRLQDTQDTKGILKDDTQVEDIKDNADPNSETDSTQEKAKAEEKKQKPKSDIDTNVGAYLKDFFKDPFEAVLSRSKPKYMVWGLIILGAYALLVFLGQLAASAGAGYSFASMFCLACGLAVMIFSFFLFQEPMKLGKKTLNEIVAVVGLSMTPMFILFFVGSVFDAAAFSYLSFWQSVLNFRLFTPPLVTVGYIFAALVLGRFFAGDDQSKMKRSFLLVLISFSAFFIIESLFMYVAIRVG